MISGQFYEGYIEYKEYTGGAKIILSWSYAGLSTTPISSANLFAPTLISSPMQLSIDCQIGYLKI